MSGSKLGKYKKGRFGGEKNHFSLGHTQVVVPLGNQGENILPVDAVNLELRRKIRGPRQGGGWGYI